MTRVNFVKKARKNYKECGIKKGESYYWWAFRFGGKYKSKTRPKESQLTQSEFLSTIYEIQERFEDINDIDTARIERDSAVEELRSLADEQQDKKSNMPDGLQEGTVGQLLEDRENYCNEFADDLENVDLDIEKEENESDEEFEERISDAISELQNCSYNGE